MCVFLLLYFGRSRSFVRNEHILRRSETSPESKVKKELARKCLGKSRKQLPGKKQQQTPGKRQKSKAVQRMLYVAFCREFHESTRFWDAKLCPVCNHERDNLVGVRQWWWLLKGYVEIWLRPEISAGRGNSYLARISPKSANPPRQLGLRHKFVPQVPGASIMVCRRL